MALHISRIRISNFRNFSECVIDPFPAPAVIVGENGVGKSNFLYALRLVLDPDLPDSARHLRPEDIHEKAIGPFGPGLPGGAEVTIEVEFSGFDDDEEAVAALSGALTQIQRPKRATVTYRFAPRALLDVDPDTGELTIDQNADQRLLTPGDYDYRVVKRSDLTTDATRLRRLVSLRVLPALRDAEGDLGRWTRSPLRTLLEDLDLDSAKLSAVASDIDAAANKLALEPEIDDLQKRLADRLRDLVGPRLPVEPTVGITSSQPESLLRGLRLFIDAARTRSVADTSLGAANILYLGMLMEALAVRRAASAFVTTMLGVEEPEAHLHVGVQRRLFRHLLATEPSLLLTTHSPHIAAVAPLDALLLFRASDSETVASTALRAGLADDEMQDVSRYLDVSRAELLFARVVVLVEGSAEVFLLPAIATAAGFDLDEHGIVLVNVAGADFSPYTKLLGKDGIDLPYAILTDGDPLHGTISPPEQGLRRAADLLADESARTEVHNGVDELIELEEAEEQDEAYDLRRSLQNRCATERIFVGDETLEIDILPLLGNELAEAFSELASPGKAANMARDIAALMTDEGLEALLDETVTHLAEEAQRENPKKARRRDRTARVLSRIDDRGKGRVAQRLADHVVAIDMRSRVLALADALDIDVDQAIIDRDEAINAELLRGLGPARACLRTLQWASLETRDRPLFDDDE